MKIVVAGPRCSGKSSIGSRLAERVGLPLVETDLLIEDLHERDTGERMPCSAICIALGEDGFRALEKRAIAEAVDRDWCVIAVGGSTMLNTDNRACLRQNSILVLLHASPSELWQRVRDRGLPAYVDGAMTRELIFHRAAMTMEILMPFADVAVDSTNMPMEETLEAVIAGVDRELALRMPRPNTFGEVVRVTTFGESHGVALGAILDGVPAGIELSEADIQAELDRRRPGQSAVATPRNEKDRVRILSGVFEGKTTGHPIGMMIENTNQDSTKYDNLRNLFRPGAADFTFWKKYGIRDHRGGGRSSGRETASRVMGGAVAKKMLAQRGVTITAHAVEIAGIRAESCDTSVIESNTVRCADADAAKKMEAAILAAKDAHDSVGGIVQLDVTGLPAGLGDPVFGKCDARLGAAILSLGAVKGIEIGDGFEAARAKGSTNNDAMRDGAFVTNHAGGLLGGITTGEPLCMRLAVKPTPSILSEQQTATLDGKNCTVSVEGRHDPCIVPRIIPVVESMAALVLLDMWEMHDRMLRFRE